MSLAQLTPEQKKQFIQDVGTDLVNVHGKKDTYSQLEIKDAARRVGAPESWNCWAFSFFMDAASFVEYHESIGEVCDYGMMRTAMVETLAIDMGTWFDLDLSWLEWPADILSGIFDCF